MINTIAIGLQDFKKIREQNTFYVDKTHFIKEWWNAKDDVTLINRPRRFGKTLTMSMVEQFFSVKYSEYGNIFEGLSIWKDEYFRSLQGTYPVISLSFSDIKETSYVQVRKKICEIIVDIYNEYDFLITGNTLNEREKEYFRKVSSEMEDYEISIALRRMANYLYKYYGKRVIILLDEYDTPMQESFVGEYWEELAAFTRSLFNATFKKNPYLERAIMTGITRVSTPKASLGKESIFSDLNNLKVVTTTSEIYADCFGFTEEEVFNALDKYGMSDKKDDVKNWYDGFTFGNRQDIYNPWSIINFLDTGKLESYWANTSANSLADKLIREGSKNIKLSFEKLLKNEILKTQIDEQIVYNQLSVKESSIWSLLLASGYLKVIKTEFIERTGRLFYYLAITNKEVRIMFENMVHDWFSDYDSNYNDFIKALLQADLKAMNVYMNRIAMTTFSFFDTGSKASEGEPERFYHGFVLGLIVELADRYLITSNRESGFGRYDVVLEPKQDDDAIIMEFKVQETDDEKNLSNTVHAALKQINERAYATDLIYKGIPENKIRKYGFAFHGKKILIGSDLC